MQRRGNVAIVRFSSISVCRGSHCTQNYTKAPGQSQREDFEQVAGHKLNSQKGYVQTVQLLNKACKLFVVSLHSTCQDLWPSAAIVVVCTAAHTGLSANPAKITAIKWDTPLAAAGAQCMQQYILHTHKHTTAQLSCCFGLTHVAIPSSTIEQLVAPYTTQNTPSVTPSKRQNQEPD